MINVIAKQLLRFVFFILLQVLVLSNIQFNGFVNPYLYVFIILMLPFATPVWLVLVISFLTGITIDMFLNSMGIHAAATVLMGYSRSYILRFFSPREGYESSTEPTLHYLGATWYLSYSILLVLIHHITYFMIEAFNVNEFKLTMYRIFFSVLFTEALLFISQMMIYKSKDTRKA